MAPFHREWFDLLESEDKLGIIAPREHAKSSIINLSDNLFDICNHGISVNQPYIVIFSDTPQQAIEHLENIVLELEENEKIHNIYGKLYEGYKRVKGRSSKWSEDTVVTSNGVKIVARGWRFRARGIRRKEERPTKIVIDDIENDDDVLSMAQRGKLKSVFEKKILNLGTVGTKFRMVGTVLHEDSLLNAENSSPRPGWVWKKYAAIDKKGKILWPEWWSRARLESKRKEIGALAFAQEFLNEIILGDDSIFRNEWIATAKNAGKDYGLWHKWDKSNNPFERVLFFGGVDLASGIRSGANYTAMVTLGLELSTGRRFIANMVRDRFTPSQQREMIVNEFENFSHHAILVESNAYQATLAMDMKEHTSVPVKSFQTTKEKFDPILGINSLAIRFENGKYIIPSDFSDERTRELVGHLVVGLTGYRPERHTEDLVMALWFAETAVRDYESKNISANYVAEANLFNTGSDNEYTRKDDLVERINRERY